MKGVPSSLEAIRKACLIFQLWYIKGYGFGPRGGVSPNKIFLSNPSLPTLVVPLMVTNFLLTSYGSLIAAVHVRHSRVIRGRFCSLDLTPLSIGALYRVAIPLNHERHVTLVVTATMTYALIHGASSTVRAEFSRVYSADQRHVVAHFCMMAHRLDLSRLRGWFRQTRSHSLAVGVSICREFY